MATKVNGNNIFPILDMFGPETHMTAIVGMGQTFSCFATLRKLLGILLFLCLGPASRLTSHTQALDNKGSIGQGVTEVSEHAASVVCI